MPPKKKPLSLYQCSIKKCINLINCACSNIQICNRENAKKNLIFMRLQEYLFTKLSAQLFNDLCQERSCVQLGADPRVQILLLAHPSMTMFRILDQDNCVSQFFWMDLLVCLTKLTVLDLNSYCTDEILSIVGRYCLLLEELNITSERVNNDTRHHIALAHPVSDSGLNAITSLKQLRILFMDKPQYSLNGRPITHNGIRKLLLHLPELEELNIKGDCGMGSILFTSCVVSKPLSLKKINCSTVTVDGMKRLISWCPKLTELNCSGMCRIGSAEIIKCIYESKLKLTKLEIQLHAFNDPLIQLLKLKGERLTDLSLIGVNTIMSFDKVLLIGECCPMLQSLKLNTKFNPSRVSHKNLQRQLYRNLQSLTIESDNVEALLLFLADCSVGLRSITVGSCRLRSSTNLDRCLTQLLKAGLLSQLMFFNMYGTEPLADSVLRNLLQLCDNLNSLKIMFNSKEDMTDVQNYIRDNNLDLKIEEINRSHEMPRRAIIERRTSGRLLRYIEFADLTPNYQLGAQAYHSPLESPFDLAVHRH